MLGAQGSTRNGAEQDRYTLQRRIALFAMVTFFVALATDVLNMIVLPVEEWLSLGTLLDRMMTVVLAVMWLLCRRGVRSFRFLRTLDAVGFLLIAVSISVMSRLMSPLILSDFSLDAAAPGVLALSDAYSGQFLLTGGAILFMFRAALIPSPPRLTAAITGILGSAFMVVPLAVRPAWDGTMTLRTPGEGVPGALLDYGVWWLIVTIVCTATSGVIYGLRMQVRAAQRLGQYTLIEKLGEGGMGAVYRATHARLQRPTAIKLLPPERLSEGAIARFENEVQLTASLTHPNTITVFDYGRTDDGVFYYAMEHLDGANLEEVVAADGAIPVERAVRILEQVTGALQEAHEVGLIHRDIKPANIMLARQGIDPDAAKLLDFGLVKPVHHDDAAQADKVEGTPLYMAPEVIQDPAAVGVATDLYSLGAVGYFLLTGTHVFSGADIVEICAHHLHTEPTAPSKRAPRPIPADLDQLILECLGKSPSRRPPSAKVLLERLRSIPLPVEWSAHRAEEWWSEHLDAIRSHRAAPTPSATLITVAA